MKLKEFGRFKEFNEYKAKDFRNYINECWRNRYNLYDDNYLYEDEDEIIKEQRFLTFDGNLVKARNYVGFISYQGENITIYPKVFSKDVKDEDIDKYLMTNLLYWLKKSSRIKLPIVDTNIEFNNRDSFLEVLIYIFSKYTSEVVYNKPYNNYEEIEEELTHLKGRLNTTEYIKSNIVTGRWNYFNTIHEPFQYNNKFNQIIKYVSKMILRFTNKKDSIENLQRIIFILDEVDDIVCNEYSCNDIKLNRLNKDYEVVLNLCEMFLKNSSILTSMKDNKLNFCFLVPMELIFEDFIFNFIKESYKESCNEITSQKSNLYLADLYIDDQKIRKAFNLKQDIYIKDKEGNSYVLDTKYKLLNKEQSLKYGISQGDMYQMSSYALRGGYKNLALIYPKATDMYTDKDIEKDGDIKYIVNSEFINEKIEIKIMLVNFVLDYDEFKKEPSNDILATKNDEILLTQLSNLINLG